MGLSQGEGTISNEQLEDILRDIMTPVEPSGEFVRRLRARLVRISDDRFPSLWLGVAAIAGASLVVLAALGMALRMLLSLLSLLGWSLRKRRPSEGVEG